MSSSESRVFRLLNNALPLAWEIYIQPRINDRRPDFVLIHPDVGVGIVEVKAWRLERYTRLNEPDGGHRLLYRGKHDFAESNPVLQIQRYRDEILDLYCPRLGKRGVKVVFGAVIFTSSQKESAERLLRPWLEEFRSDRYPLNCTISGVNELAVGDIGRIFPAAKLSNHPDFNPSLAADLRSWLGESSHVSDLRKEITFSPDQEEVVITRTESGFRRIKGPAGSGKSLVLVAKAGFLAAQRKRVLVLTYNITLVNYLRDIIQTVPRIPPGVRQKVVWFNFHAWLRRVCQEAGEGTRYKSIWHDYLLAQTKPDKREDQLAAPLNAVVALVEDVFGRASSLKYQYDAILIDEGQDYAPAWVSCISKALRPGGELLLAKDATQDIYDQAKSQTEERWSSCGFRGPWKRLNVCYRIPDNLQQLLNEFSRGWIHDREADPPESQLSINLVAPGCRLRWRDCRADSLADAAFKEIIRLVTMESDQSTRTVVFPEIVVLVPNREIGCLLSDSLRKRGVTVFHTFSENRLDARRAKAAFRLTSAKVKLTTTHSFKGIETRAMIVVVPPSNGEQLDAKLLYTALSRLKADHTGSFLTVVSANCELRRFGSKWPDFQIDRPL